MKVFLTLLSCFVSAALPPDQTSTGTNVSMIEKTLYKKKCLNSVSDMAKSDILPQCHVTDTV